MTIRSTIFGMLALLGACGGGDKKAAAPAAPKESIYKPGQPLYDDVAKDVAICVGGGTPEAYKASIEATRAKHAAEPLSKLNLVEAVEEVCKAPTSNADCCTTYKQVNATS